MLLIESFMRNCDGSVININPINFQTPRLLTVVLATLCYKYTSQ